MLRTFGKLFMAAGILLVASCTKDSHSIPAGTATLRVIPRYHGENLKDCTVYIKHGSLNKPASMDQYTTFMPCKMVDGLYTGVFHGVMKGDYYLYAVGSAPGNTSQTLAGGIPYRIAKEKGVFYTIEIDLAVAELNK